MTEQDWLVCRDPDRMVKSLPRKASPRKVRLFAAACCRRISHLLRDAKHHRAIDTAERFADGLAKRGEVKSWWKALGPRAADDAELAVNGLLITCLTKNKKLRLSSFWWAITAAEMAVPGGWFAFWSRWKVRAEERAVQAVLLRDILGNPFRPATIDLVWKTPAVVQLAETLYAERRFEDMPVLADALEEVGCQDATVLEHCRCPGPHVAGCWVLDQVVGKT